MIKNCFLAMAEYLHVYNKNGEYLKTGERSQLYDELIKYSLKTGEAPFAVEAVHLLLFNSKGELYLVQRAYTKNKDPGKWSTTVGAHVPAENPDLPPDEDFLNRAYKAILKEAHDETNVIVELVSHHDYEL